jgi:hypothetical protein
MLSLVTADSTVGVDCVDAVGISVTVGTNAVSACFSSYDVCFRDVSISTASAGDVDGTLAVIFGVRAVVDIVAGADSGLSCEVNVVVLIGTDVIRVDADTEAVGIDFVDANVGVSSCGGGLDNEGKAGIKIGAVGDSWNKCLIILSFS